MLSSVSSGPEGEREVQAVCGSITRTGLTQAAVREQGQEHLQGVRRTSESELSDGSSGLFTVETHRETLSPGEDERQTRDTEELRF